jgi:hypothetical protein
MVAAESSEEKEKARDKDGAARSNGRVAR